MRGTCMTPDLLFGQNFITTKMKSSYRKQHKLAPRPKANIYKIEIKCYQSFYYYSFIVFYNFDRQWFSEFRGNHFKIR